MIPAQFWQITSSIIRITCERQYLPGGAVGKEKKEMHDQFGAGIFHNNDIYNI